MLAIPLKKTEKVRLSKSFEVFVAKTYDAATVEKVRPVFVALEEARRVLAEGTENSSPEILIEACETYLSGLIALEGQIAISNTDLKFQWYDGYTKTKYLVLTYASEKVHVLYTLAALHSKIAAEVDLRTANAHKIALNSSQIGAGWLLKCRNELNNRTEENKSDISFDNISLWIDVLIAQGYYTMYDKLDKSTANKLNISKVAYSISTNFSQALVYIPSVKSFPKDLENLAGFYSGVFLAAAHYYYALNDKEKCMKTGIGFGKIVSRLKVADGIITKAMWAKGIRGTALNLGRNLMTLITNEKNVAEGDNFTIYMDRVPEESTLEALESLNMVTPKTPEIKEFPNAELLLSMVPKEAEKFKESKSTCVDTQTNYEESKKIEENSSLSKINENIWNGIGGNLVSFVENNSEEQKKIKTTSEEPKNVKNTLKDPKNLKKTNLDSTIPEKIPEKPQELKNLKAIPSEIPLAPIAPSKNSAQNPPSAFIPQPVQFHPGNPGPFTYSPQYSNFAPQYPPQNSPQNFTASAPQYMPQNIGQYGPHNPGSFNPQYVPQNVPQYNPQFSPQYNPSYPPGPYQYPPGPYQYPPGPQPTQYPPGPQPTQHPPGPIQYPPQGSNQYPKNIPYEFQKK